MHGTIISQGLAKVLTDIDGKFSPHAVHAMFKNPVSATVSWDIENISDGNNFINRSLIGKHQGRLNVFMNVSLTSKNSFQNSLSRYEEYQALITRRKSQGKTDDDDSDDDIKPVEVPFKFQVPFPELNEQDLGRHSMIKHGIEFKGDPNIDLTRDNYTTTIKYFSRLVEDEANKYLAIARLIDSINFLNLSPRNLLHLQGAIIYFHDDDFNAHDFITFQLKISSISYGKILMELELFNPKGVQFSTIYLESLLVPALSNLSKL